MSHHPSHSTEHMPPPEAQAEEMVNWTAIGAIGVGVLCIFAVLIVISTKWMDLNERKLQPWGPDATPRDIGKVEIGIVDQAPFDVTHYLADYRADKNGRLNSWGWVDRKAGVIHIPIEQAMEKTVAEQKK